MGFVARLLASFVASLTGRKQKVKINNVVSDPLNINIGLPQGSALSAILYLIYINDLPNFSGNCHQILYADDTTLCFQGKSLYNLSEICNITLTEFSKWAVANRLTINPEKTNSMIFSNISIPEHVPNLSLNGHYIEQVNNFKFLGVTLDPKLKFNLHIQASCNKVSKSIGIIRHISKFVSTPTLISLYYSLIYPYLTYCSLIWGTTYETHLNPLIILQKRAIRIINKVNYSEHTSPLFFSNKILKLKDLIKYRQAIYVYKNILQFSTPAHSYSTRNRNNLSIPFQRLTIAQHSLSYCGPATWNSLPEYIKTAHNISNFKKLLREHFLMSYTEHRN